METSTEILSVIDTLTAAVNVCYSVDNSSEDHEKSYPFATGYSKAAMQNAIKDLTHILNKFQQFEERMNNEN